MPHDITPLLAAAEKVCIRNGTQLTPLRRDVLGLILHATTPLTAYQLLDQLKTLRQSAVPPTIYRALEFLLQNHLIHKIERLNAFVPCVEATHHHDDAQFLICKKCCAVQEIEDHDISHALARAAAAHGFVTSRAMVELDGLCAACAAATPA